MVIGNLAVGPGKSKELGRVGRRVKGKKDRKGMVSISVLSFYLGHTNLAGREERGGGWSRGGGRRKRRKGSTGTRQRARKGQEKQKSSESRVQEEDWRGQG